MTEVPIPQLRDEPTRLLSAAAHLSSEFCTRALREFVGEPLRATVPSPGVRARVVLREALAARARRRWRDGILAVLLLGMVLDSRVGFAIWVLVAVAWKVAGPSKRRIDRSRRVPPAMPVLVGLGTVTVVIGAGVGLFTAVEHAQLDPYGLTPHGTAADQVRLVFAAVLPLLAFGVLLADRVAVLNLLTVSFRRGRFHPEPPAGERVRTVGTTSENARELLSRARDHDGNVIVYADQKPFVGHGVLHRTWSITIPLEPDDDGDGHRPGGPDRLPPAFPLRELYDHIGASLRELRMSSRALSPSHRLGELDEFETLVVPADELVSHAGEPAANLLLLDPYRPPNVRLDRAQLAFIADNPIEWMRYYRGFRVTSWESDLVVSTFIHVGADRDMLYFECSPCILPPIKDQFRMIDRLSRTSVLPALADATGSLLALPVMIFGRLWGSFRPILGRLDPDDLRSDRYGARFSLRELAAVGTVGDYLQGRDVDRYLTIIEDRIFKATAAFLREKGISSRLFEEKARMIQNSFTFSNSSFVNSAFGNGASVNPPSAPASPAPASA